jgi:hypothetical protein
MNEATVAVPNRPRDFVRRGPSNPLLRVRDWAEKRQITGHDHRDFSHYPGGNDRLSEIGLEMMIWMSVRLPRTCLVWFIGLQLIMFSLMAEGMF